MTATRASDYPALGFDPTPGDVSEVLNLSLSLNSVSNALDEIVSVLHGADAGDWRGDAAVAFRDLLDDDLRPKVDASAKAFAAAKRTIAAWHTDLDRFQTRARGLEQQAAAVAQRVESRSGHLAGLPAAPLPGTPAPTDPDAAQQQRDDASDRAAAERSLHEAEGELRELRSSARRLHDEYVTSGETVARGLADAIDAAPNEPGWLSRAIDSLGDALDAIGDFIGDLADKLVDVLHKLAPLLKIIGDIAGLLSTVLGLLAFIPGLQFLAIPALVLGGVALLAHYASAVGTTGSFLEALKDPDVLLDAAGVVLGLGALKLGKMLTTAARASGNTRMVPQLIGAAQEVPYGFFNVMRGTVTSMNTTEAVVRTVSLKATYAGFALTGAGGQSTLDTLGKIFTGNFGPMTQRSVVR